VFEEVKRLEKESFDPSAHKDIGQTVPPSSEAGDGEGRGGKRKRRRWAGAGRQWRLVPLLLALMIFGLSVGGTAAFLRYTDRSEFCLGCHVMEQPYERWYHSAHRLGATCSDCHVPHQNLASKLIGKGGDGLRHLYYFYTNQIPDPIRLSAHGSKTVQENCLRCHGPLLERVSQEDRRCWECHRAVPHGY